MRVVLDTNVVISGIFFAGTPVRIVDAWIDDEFDLAISMEILEKYRDVAVRVRAKFPGVELCPVLDRIASHALLVVSEKLPDDARAYLSPAPAARRAAEVPQFSFPIDA